MKTFFPWGREDVSEVCFLTINNGKVAFVSEAIFAPDSLQLSA